MVKYPFTSPHKDASVNVIKCASALGQFSSLLEVAGLCAQGLCCQPQSRPEVVEALGPDSQLLHREASTAHIASCTEDRDSLMANVFASPTTVPVCFTDQEHMPK
jgi:hypothetical protein